jgi:hypothetical protein
MPLTFKVCGIHDSKGTLPTYLTKDMIVTLVSGKWPLRHYNDCDRHTFVFMKADGTKFFLTGLWVYLGLLLTEGRTESIY